MQCPKCGAENPANAENCNLCFYSFVERPEPARPVEPEIPSRKSRVELLSTDTRSITVKGGLAGALGGLLFLVSLTIIHVTGVRVFDFLFAGTEINRANLSFFVLVLGVFSLFSGGVGGNLEDKRDIVPAVRTVAALVGLGLWVGVVFAFKPGDSAFFVWLTGGAAGVILSLTAFPLVAMFLGMSESFGEEMSSSRALWGAAGGFVSGILTAVVVGLGYLATPLFGSTAPAGILAIMFFAFEMMILTGAIGFIAGASLWMAIEIAERNSS